MTKRSEHNAHEVSWTLRSLLAAGLLSVCAVATAISASVNAERAEIARSTEAEIAREAALVADLASYLAGQTAATRDALSEPRIKPAPAAASLSENDEAQLSLANFDFSILADARSDGLDRKCLAQAIYYEARSEAKIGQIAVADVVLNRVASPYYPNTICDVVFQGSERRTGCQFSFTCDGSMNIRLNKRKWNSSDELAGAILSGLRAPVSRDATHYHADYVDPYWAPRMSPTATIGTHKFYRFPGAHVTEAAPAAM